MTTPIPIDAGSGGYVRWRNRMCRLSILNDMIDTLTKTGWMGDLAVDNQYPFDVKEFFPEFAVYAQDAVHINTIALDDGEPFSMEEYETGGMYSRLYRMNFAFYAQDNDTGMSVLMDLADRYEGLTNIPYVPLYNYATTPSTLVVQMEVQSFQYTRAPLDAAPYDHHLFFGELILKDFVDQNRVEMAP